jgi:hydrogenase maturation protein HypF
MGRLFDAVAAIAGVRQEVTYEAQAAIELEAVLDPQADGHYLIELIAADDKLVIDPTQALHEIVSDVRSGESPGSISARFHRGIADAAAAACVAARDSNNVEEVCLSGGVFQNVTLLGLTVSRLEAEGFGVYWHRKVPPNDGGLALGQAVVAAAQVLHDGSHAPPEPDRR